MLHTTYHIRKINPKGSSRVWVGEKATKGNHMDYLKRVLKELRVQYPEDTIYIEQETVVITLEKLEF